MERRLYSSSDFEFVAANSGDNVRVPVDASIATRDALFDVYAASLGFPSYFGRNWDAFIDCLSDLSWIDRDEVAVVHAGLPALRPQELRTYLECLLDVLGRLRSNHRPALRVYFQEQDRAAIDAVLS